MDFDSIITWPLDFLGLGSLLKEVKKVTSNTMKGLAIVVASNKFDKQCLFLQNRLKNGKIVQKKAPHSRPENFKNSKHKKLVKKKSIPRIF